MAFKELTKLVLFNIGDDKEKEEGWDLNKSHEKSSDKKCC
jgi:hypothetical protein